MKTKNNVFVFAMLFLLMAFSVAAQSTVNLGAAQNFSIVAQTTITDATPAGSHIVGNIAIDPAAGSFIPDTSCTNVVGTIYDNNAGYTGGWDSNTSCLVTDAVETLAVQSAMVTAYNDARGRTGTNVTELGAGNLGGLTLTPGLYKWSSAVTIPTNVTLDCEGNANAVFIMQMSQTLAISNGKSVVLAGSCNPANIFWQADTGVTLGTTAEFNGNILAGTQITINSGAKLNGRAFAQTAVTLSANNVTIPTGGAPVVVQSGGGNPIGTGGSIGTPQKVTASGSTKVVAPATDLSWLWWILGGLAVLALLAWGLGAATKGKRRR